MLSFREYLSEQYKNLLPRHEEDKVKHAHEVFNLIQTAYKDQGGIHGSGFKSPEDMVQNIPMWKLSKKDGKVTGVALYKDSEGRKRVAIATDGSDHGKKAIGNVVRDDLKQTRAHMEVSGKSLSFLKKQIHISDHVHSYEAAEKYHAQNGTQISHPPEDDPEVVRHPELKDHFYQRKIGDHFHTKLLLGKTGNSIS